MPLKYPKGRHHPLLGLLSLGLILFSILYQSPKVGLVLVDLSCQTPERGSDVIIKKLVCQTKLPSHSMIDQLFLDLFSIFIGDSWNASWHQERVSRDRHLPGTSTTSRVTATKSHSTLQSITPGGLIAMILGVASDSGVVKNFLGLSPDVQWE